MGSSKIKQIDYSILKVRYRRHSGLGLSIAKRFVEEQGGFLEYGNRRDGAGAEVALWLKVEGKLD